MSRVWLPYAQMRHARPPLEVTSGEGVRLRLADGRELVDGVASWWCAIHGYGHPALVAAATAQVGELSHVMLGGLVHRKTEELAERLAALTGLPHVFFGDSGSVGVEVALKMAIQSWRNRGRPAKRRVLGFEGAYHGDTLGAMSVCDPHDGMHRLFAGVLPEQLFAPVDEDAAARVIAEHSASLAAVILEPLVQCAGGFRFHPPAFVRRVRELCDEHDVLLILDEVATGFGRAGTFLAAEQAGVRPDILVLGKALTGGMLGHSATLASDRVYDAFLGDDDSLAFMHGPTFMGNALACAVAVAGLELFATDGYLARVARIERRLREGLEPLRGRPGVVDVRVRGAIGVVEVADAGALTGFQEAAVERGVWLRPFGRWAYTMPPYVIEDADLRRVTAVFAEFFGGPCR